MKGDTETELYHEDMRNSQLALTSTYQMLYKILHVGECLRVKIYNANMLWNLSENQMPLHSN